MLSLTASELPRFMACNGHRLLNKVPKFDDDNTSAAEGDAAHWLCEQVFHKKFTADELIDRKAPNGVFITAEMVEYCQRYIDYICEVGGAVEHQTNHASIRGRADHVIINEIEAFISDFKYGWGIVEPFENWTLLSHAIAIFETNPNIANFTLRIFQPRPFHPEGDMREWYLTSEQLVTYRDKLYAALNNPSDQLQTSNHCYRCPSMGLCPAAQLAAMNALEVTHEAFNSEPTDDRLEWFLDTLTRASKILDQSLNAYEEIAKHRLTEGKMLKNYGLAKSLSNAKWKDMVDADFIKAMSGVDVSKPADMITPTQAIKKGVPETIVKSLSYRQEGAVKLVREDVQKKLKKLLKPDERK